MGIFRKSRRDEREGKKYLEDGAYVGIITSAIIKEGKYGEYLEVTFKIGANGLTKRVALDTWVGERNKTRKFLEAIGVRNNFEMIEEKDLIGKYCVVVLQTIEREGRKVQRIVDFREVK